MAASVSQAPAFLRGSSITNAERHTGERPHYTFAAYAICGVSVATRRPLTALRLRASASSEPARPQISARVAKIFVAIEIQPFHHKMM